MSEENNNKKNLEVVEGIGNLDISPVYDHLPSAKPKSIGEKPSHIVIPEVKKKVSNDEKENEDNDSNNQDINNDETNDNAENVQNDEDVEDDVTLEDSESNDNEEDENNETEDIEIEFEDLLDDLTDENN